MKQSLIRSLVLTIACVGFIFAAGFFLPSVPAISVSKTGVTDLRAQVIDSNLLVWGLTAKGGFTITMYDPSLKEVHTYTKEVPGFVGGEVQLEFYSDTALAVQLIGKDRRQQVNLELDQNLIEKRCSKPHGYAKLHSATDQQFLTQIRTDKYLYSLETELSHPSMGAQKRQTWLKKLSYNDSLPFDDWNLMIDSSAIDYGKTISVRNNRIYVYVNHSMTEGQFIYCFDEKDGKQIYKTKLVVKSTDFHRERWHDDEAFAGSDACIYSNCLWDSRTTRLTIAGTWMGTFPNVEYPHTKSYGLFLMQLNDDGSIAATDADYYYWLESKTSGIGYNNEGYFSRDAMPYYRIADMAYEEDGRFSLFAEVYGLVCLSIPQKGDKMGLIYLQDSSYHYFTIQKHVYSVRPGSILPSCKECIVRTTPWIANHHLDSIKGFIPGQTKVYDEQYPDNINEICDASRADGHFIDGERVLKGRNGTKVLTKNKVDVNGKVCDAYFEKTMYVPNANWMAFLSPEPVKGQDFSRPAEYFAANSGWLYRLEVNAGGYELRMVRW